MPRTYTSTSKNLALLVFFYLLGVQILGAVAAYVLSMAFGAALALACLPRVFPDSWPARPGTKVESSPQSPRP